MRPTAPPPAGSYTAQPVRFEASKWCEYGTLDVETRAAKYYEATDGHEPGADLIYDGCGPGATLTARRTNSPALGRGSTDSTTAERCRQDAQSENTQEIRNIPAGEVLCLVTGEGGVARKSSPRWYEPFTEDGAPSLELEITYWAQP